MRISFSMDKPIPSVKKDPQFNAKIRETLRTECIRIKNYAKDHTNFNDRTGQLSRSIDAWSLRHTKFGYTMQVGIREEPLIIERWRGREILEGKTTIDLATWLVMGTSPHTDVPSIGYYYFRGYHAYKSGNPKKSGHAGWWKIDHPIDGIDPRTNFIQNAFSRTKRLRDERFKQLKNELKLK